MTIQTTDLKELTKLVELAVNEDGKNSKAFLKDLYGEHAQCPRYNLIQALRTFDSDQLTKPMISEVFKSATKTQRYAYRYVAENWDVAVELRKNNGYHKINKNGAQEKVPYSPATIDGVRSAIRKRVAVPTEKKPMTQEKLVELIVSTCFENGYNLLEVAKQAKALNDKLETTETVNNPLELDTLKSIAA